MPRDGSSACQSVGDHGIVGRNDDIEVVPNRPEPSGAASIRFDRSRRLTVRRKKIRAGPKKAPEFCV
jgi:hypothetical protein